MNSSQIAEEKKGNFSQIGAYIFLVEKGQAVCIASPKSCQMSFIITQ